MYTHDEAAGAIPRVVHEYVEENSWVKQILKEMCSIFCGVVDFSSTHDNGREHATAHLVIQGFRMQAEEHSLSTQSRGFTVFRIRQSHLGRTNLRLV